MPTDYQFTGQRRESGLGLYDYNARYYDPYLNRFISPDTIIPDPANPQSLNRYSYVLNSPLRYTDPSGHCSGDPNDPENHDIGCWEMIGQIEDSCDNVSITNTDQWTEAELRLLLKALQEYRLWRYIYTARDITFGRQSNGDSNKLTQPYVTWMDNVTESPVLLPVILKK